MGCSQQMKGAEAGRLDLAENIIDAAPVTLSVKLCSGVARPSSLSLNGGGAGASEEMFVQPLWRWRTARSMPPSSPANVTINSLASNLLTKTYR